MDAVSVHFLSKTERQPMRILVIGDVTSQRGVEHLCKNLWKYRRENRIDFCVVNGENASFISGIVAEQVGTRLPFPSNASYSVLEYDGEKLVPIEYSVDSHMPNVTHVHL